MVTDLVGRLSRALPDLTIEPHIFENDISIGDLAAHLGSRLSPATAQQQALTPVRTQDYVQYLRNRHGTYEYADFTSFAQDLSGLHPAADERRRNPAE